MPKNDRYLQWAFARFPCSLAAIFLGGFCWEVHREKFGKLLAISYGNKSNREWLCMRRRCVCGGSCSAKGGFIWRGS